MKNKCLYIFLTVLCAIAAIYVNRNFEKIKTFFSTNNNGSNLQPKSQRITVDNLKLYNGLEKNELYLSILGNVFDVTAGSDKYGPGKTYHFFTGKDGSRNFINGLFTENDASDKVDDLTGEQLLSLQHWVEFYDKEYKKVGKLIGTYYDNEGELTDYGRKIKKLIVQAEQAKYIKSQQEQKFPSCNVEWSAEKGTHIWCTEKSGGVTRDWVGFPRELYEPGSKDNRCVCVHENNLSNPILKQYENCDSHSNHCYLTL